MADAVGPVAIRRLSCIFGLLTYRMAYCGGMPRFGMRTYKKVGTDPALLEMYSGYQRFGSILKLDWLLQIELLALSLLGLHEFGWRWWLTASSALLASRPSRVPRLSLACAAPPQISRGSHRWS